MLSENVKNLSKVIDLRISWLRDQIAAQESEREAAFHLLTGADGWQAVKKIAETGALIDAGNLAIQRLNVLAGEAREQAKAAEQAERQAGSGARDVSRRLEETNKFLNEWRT